MREKGYAKCRGRQGAVGQKIAADKKGDPYKTFQTNRHRIRAYRRHNDDAKAFIFATINWIMLQKQRKPINNHKSSTIKIDSLPKCYLHLILCSNTENERSR